MKKTSVNRSEYKKSSLNRRILADTVNINWNCWGPNGQILAGNQLRAIILEGESQSCKKKEKSKKEGGCISKYLTKPLHKH